MKLQEVSNVYLRVLMLQEGELVPIFEDICSHSFGVRLAGGTFVNVPTHQLLF